MPFILTKVVSSMILTGVSLIVLKSTERFLSEIKLVREAVPAATNISLVVVLCLLLA
ncbi:hypothetical protein RI543_003777 [Arxiozyma heterogenica]|uniref:Uncharacterized protein n=1 Tax=Arxiozyma heterogenica TaxID=278026 RepID=A0AAN7WNM7_9SACH|nr:hypothetical protein RI543_003777 [Kazachstania heterogenica]